MGPGRAYRRVESRVSTKVCLVPLESKERPQQVVCYRTGALDLEKKVGRGEDQFAYLLLWLAWLVYSKVILK